MFDSATFPANPPAGSRSSADRSFEAEGTERITGVAPKTAAAAGDDTLTSGTDPLAWLDVARREMNSRGARRRYTEHLIEALVEWSMDRPAQIVGHLAIIAAEHPAQYMARLGNLLKPPPRGMGGKGRPARQSGALDEDEPGLQLSAADKQVVDAMVWTSACAAARRQSQRARRSGAKSRPLGGVGGRSRGGPA